MRMAQPAWEDASRRARSSLKLEAIRRDPFVAAASIKTLAAILIRFNHTVTEPDKDALRPLMP